MKRPQTMEELRAMSPAARAWFLYGIGGVFSKFGMQEATMNSTVMEEVFRTVTASSEALANERTLAHEESVAAIRCVLAYLKVALAGERLRGLPNLVPEWSRKEKYEGANVRSTTSPSTPLPDLPLTSALIRTGLTALVLTPECDLVLAYRHAECGALSVQKFTVADADLRGEDLEALLRTLLAVLPAHVEASKAAKARYTKMRDLATMVRKVLPK